MLKSIGLAAVLAVISFVQPPTALAQDRSFNQWNSSNYASTQNRSDYGNHGTGQDRSNYRGYSSDRNRGNSGEYSGYSATREHGNHGSYGYNRQNITNDYQTASQLRYERPANDRFTRESGSQSFRNVRDGDDHRSNWR
jgi:hypothetical protein